MLWPLAEHPSLGLAGRTCQRRLFFFRWLTCATCSRRLRICSGRRARCARFARGQTQLWSLRISNLPFAPLTSTHPPTRLPGDAGRPQEGARKRAGGCRVRVGCDGRLCERYDEYEVGQDRQVGRHGEVGGDSEVGREAKLRRVEQVCRVRGRVRGVQQQESLTEQWEARKQEAVVVGLAVITVYGTRPPSARGRVVLRSGRLFFSSFHILVFFAARLPLCNEKSLLGSPPTALGGGRAPRRANFLSNI